MLRMTGGVLLDERIVAVQPSLVRAFGLNRAVVIQQIHFHRNNTGTEAHDGWEWVVMPYDVLSDETGLTVRQLRGAVEKLEEEGILLSTQPQHWDRTKWYRLDYQHERFVQFGPTAENGDTKRPIRRQSSAENGFTPLSKNRKNRDESESTRQAHAVTAERHMELTAELDAVEASPRSSEHLAAIKNRLRGGGMKIEEAKAL